MMQNTNEREYDESANVVESKTWSDIAELSRRVIHAANLAVMAHAELDPFAEATVSEGHSSKKAG